MGKDKEKYIIISGFRLDYSNRGNSALCYGTITFLKNNHNLKNQTILKFHYFKNFLKPCNFKSKREVFSIQGKRYIQLKLSVFWLEYMLLKWLGILLPFTRFGRVMRNVDYLASDYGGDGFSDIYGHDLFMSRLGYTWLAMKAQIPLIMLPQTVGPFQNKADKAIAVKVMKYATKIYTRDNKCDAMMRELGLDYELSNDLSAFMCPQPFDIKIEEDSVGINISGLAYSNRFKDLSGQFENYPYLCTRLVKTFQNMGKTVYLISHSYNYNQPEENNDDICAAREFYSAFGNKDGVVLIDRDLTSPQTKYVISRMSFFVGTRMHANYAAIFTNVPVYGLAYSYKFQGAFERNGIKDSVSMINNISREEADVIVDKIIEKYERTSKKQ